MPKEMTAGALAERSLITKYRKMIWNRFIGGCKDYELIWRKVEAEKHTEECKELLNKENGEG